MAENNPGYDIVSLGICIDRQQNSHLRGWDGMAIDRGRRQKRLKRRMFGEIDERGYEMLRESQTTREG